MNTPTSILKTRGVESLETVEETLVAADLNWKVEEDQVAGMDTGISFPGSKLLYRSDDRRPLGIVGEDYSPSDPREFVESQFEFAEAIGGKVDRVGFIDDRSKVFSVVSLNNLMKIPREKRKKGDPVGVYIYSTDGWNGWTPCSSRLYLENLTCLNGMVSRKIRASLWVSHTKNREVHYGDRWKTFLNEINVSVKEIRADFVKLAEERMDEKEFKEVLQKLLPGESKVTEKRRQEILHLFGGGIGNEGLTRWDAFNAVTEYTTHRRTFRETDTTSKETNRFLGVVEAPDLNEKAFDLLVA